MNYHKLNHPIKKPKILSDMNIVPYVDVMLVLLVIFMITTPLLTQGVEVHLPQAKANTLREQAQIPLIISVDAKGYYYFNKNSDSKTPIPPQQLLTRVAAHLQMAAAAHRPPPSVLVKGDKSVSYDVMMHAMSLLQQAGATQIGLIVDAS